MRNIDLEHGTAVGKLQVTLHAVKSCKFLSLSSLAQVAANLRKRDATRPLLIELEAARLERAADLPLHRLVAAQCRHACHFGDDRHVVFAQAMVCVPHFASASLAALDMPSASHQVGIQP